MCIYRVTFIAERLKAVKEMLTAKPAAYVTAEVVYCCLSFRATEQQSTNRIGTSYVIICLRPTAREFKASLSIPFPLSPHTQPLFLSFSGLSSLSFPPEYILPSHIFLSAHH